MENDVFLMNEFRKALLKNAGEALLNLDDKFLHKFDFFIQRYEEIFKTVGSRIPPHKWSYYRIGLVKEGSADFVCGMYKFRAIKNTLVIIPARVVNSSKWSEDAAGCLLIFNLDFFLQNHFPHKYLENKKILHPSVQPYLRLTEEQADDVSLIFQTILNEKDSDHTHRNELIALKVIELLILCERLYGEIHGAIENENTLDTVKRFADMVEEYFTKEKSVGFYASQLHIHPNYLNALIKAHTGFTAKESILNRIHLESKFLLHTTSLSIKEISSQMGFADPNYFAVFFKRFENQSPAAYRASFI